MSNSLRAVLERVRSLVREDAGQPVTDTVHEKGQPPSVSGYRDATPDGALAFLLQRTKSLGWRGAKNFRPSAS